MNHLRTSIQGEHSMIALLACLGKVYRNSLLLSCVAACSLLLPAEPVLADSNPTSTRLPVNYRNTPGGMTISVTYLVTADATNGLWNPLFEPWNGKLTSASHRIENVISPVGFPFTASADTVTAPKCKDAWDADFPDWTYVSAATCVYNCYAYATGKSYWINAPGFNILMQDEYTIHQGDYCKQGCVLKLLDDHALKLDECCIIAEGPDTIKKASQKCGTGPVYQITFACPPGDNGPDGATMYCKN